VAYREAHPDRVREQARAYALAHQDEVRECKLRYNEAHREEAKEYSRRYREEHPGQSVANIRAWRDRNPSYGQAYYSSHKEQYKAHVRNRRARVRETEGAHTAEDIAAQYARQKGRCYWGKRVNPECTVSLKSGYHVDHVIPLAGERESSNGIENLVLTCPSCNLRKQAKDPMDFAGIMF
jgi:5-methylcytosine-specific restriction endonuclease McrA